MVLAGMNVARVNFTHATLEERKLAISSVREVRKKNWNERSNSLGY